MGKGMVIPLHATGIGGYEKLPSTNRSEEETQGQKKSLILGIDQGTTGTTVLAFDSSLHVAASWYGQHRQLRPGQGLLEHDPEEILEAVVEGVRCVLNDLGQDRDQVAAVGLANQGETVCAWDGHTGQPLYNAIVWSDSRGSEQIEALTQDQRDRLMALTGLQPDSYFSAPKIAWLLKNVPEIRQALTESPAEARDARLRMGTLDTWMIWKLSSRQVYFTDASTASRTMLYELTHGQWSEEAGKLIGLPPLPLAKIGPSYGPIATLSHEAWPVDSLPLLASLVDQPAALFAHGCWKPGQAKATYGTGCFFLMNTGQTPLAERNGLTASVAWDVDGLTYMLDGAVYAAGSIIEWLRKDLRWINDAHQIDEMLSNPPARRPRLEQVRDGLFFVPTLDGLSGPHWRRDVRGFITGLTLATGPADIIRAALDGVAHQVTDLVECIPSTAGLRLKELRVDGGLSACDYLMQKQADLLGKPVRASKNREMTALGAAAMAGLATGVLSQQELLRLLGDLTGRTYRPQISTQQRLQERTTWQRAVRVAMSAAEIFVDETQRT
jgi:glycerol kinase